ncbi:alpha/beta hydrolase [Amycolatopsis sp. H20-H5]|uniref:alpha/beta hydrolase n=1 Tax=Amycolatopsis sp. H20-H5 TaxID=3046309 RepID=UPI002DBF547C|nr:alpha/beta hydrolase-fold protein [Amycolatopsis sp. H20-H5]MEC3979672.1 alpha/beta hydrolase-fold protein [Amycolatopsis sp. H20-H5]
MLPWSTEFAGVLEEHDLTSTVLRGNPLGDPHVRPIWVYLPPGYGDDPGRRYPVVYVLQGYTGHLGMWRNRTPFRQPFPELADAMFARGEAPPGIVVYVDAWTSLGGSQFVDSPGTGNYHSYLCDEVVPWVDERYRTLADRDHRAITGKSSGGYGAMITPMRRPELFGAFATHAGDALFDAAYRPEFPMVARLLLDEYGGSVTDFLADFRSRIPMSRESDGPLLEFYGYSAAYSADPDGTVRLPFDEFGATVPAAWERWLAHDPVVMAGQPHHADALRSMRAIWIDAGNRDQYYLDLGAQAFRRVIAAAGVADERVYFELFDGTHRAIEYRYPLALAWLLRRMAGD